MNIRIQQGLFNERSGGVTFLSQTVFRTEIPLPDNVPVGDYAVDLKLFQNGKMITERVSSLRLQKSVSRNSCRSEPRDHSLFYGLSVMSMGLLPDGCRRLHSG